MDIKQIYLSILMLLFGGLESGLFSQEVYSTKDSIITYEFSSASDSIPRWKNLLTRVDSTALFRSGIMFEWNKESGMWVPLFIDSSIIQLSGLHRTEFIREWDAGSADWKPDVRVENSYLDSMTKVTINEGWQWDPVVDNWIGFFRSENEYDESRNLIASTQCDWSAETEEWECRPNISHDLVYDAEGFVVEETRLNWIDNNWVKDRKYEYDYDTLGREVMLTRSKWNQDFSQWDLEYMTERFYDASGRDTLSEKSWWQTDPDYWRKDNIFRSEYDSNGKLAVTSRWTLQIPQQDWACERKFYYYDAHGNLEYHKIFLKYPGFETFQLFRTVWHYPGTQYRILYGSLCRGDSLFWQDNYYTESCNLTEQFTAVTGVDSIYKLNLSVYERPGVFAITDLSGQDAYCVGETVNYTVPGHADLSYTWLSQQGVIQSGQGSDTLVLEWIDSNNPELLCWAENQHGCISDTTVLYAQILLCNGVKEEEPLAGILFYPVPVKDLLYIHTDLDDPDLLQIGVVDLSGSEVAAAHGSSIDLSQLPAGTYLVRIKDREGIIIGVRKIVKVGDVK